MRLTLAQIGQNRTIKFAVTEIARLIKAMDKRLCLDIRRYDKKDDTAANVLWVGLDDSVEKDSDDAILIDIKNGAGIITGSNERSVLIAAYKFMTELGCRFLYPGKEGEKIPSKSLQPSDLTVFVNEKPSYRHRGICIEGAVGFEHVCNTLDWLPKVGMNTYYSQFFVPATFFKRYYGNDITDDDVSAMMQVIEEEIEKRSIVYHAIGHGWTSAPYNFYASGWEKYEGEISDELRSALALFKGERKFFNNMPISTQLCFSNPEAMETVTDFAVDYCKKHKNINYLAMAMGDGGRNHCECEECIKKRPSDHYVDLLNLLDEKLTIAGIETKLTFSAYADTLFAPAESKIKNLDRFVLKLCPIARSFAKSYDEVDLDNLPETAPFVLNKDMPRDTEELNIAYFKKWQEIYTGDTCVYDYQLIWNHQADPGYYEVAKYIHRDIKDLERLGLNGMISCQVLRAAFPTGLPQYTMAKTLWNKSIRFDEIKDEYFNSAFGDNAKLVEDYLKTLSELGCFAFVTGKKKFSKTEVNKRYAQLKETVIKFREDYIEKFKNTSDEWEYLYAHSLLVPIFADVYLSRYNGDEDAVKKYSLEFKEKIKELKPVIDSVCDDVGMNFTLLSKYLMRHTIEQ